jgi:hypothetical protein
MSQLEGIHKPQIVQEMIRALKANYREKGIT